MDRNDKRGSATDPAISPMGAAYLELLRRCLTRDVVHSPYRPLAALPGWKGTLLAQTQRALGRKGLTLVRHDEVTDEDRAEGRGWPATAETMMGLRRLEHLQRLLTEVLEQGISGDLFEAGCWRGGAVIFMLAVLRAFGDTDRQVWAADSFEGYPAPTAQSHAEDELLWRRPEYFAVPRAVFEANVRRYGLWDPRLHVLQGWFSDTIPKASLRDVAFLRIDVDGYEGVRDALRHVYPKMPVGGVVWIEDVRPPGAKRALDEFWAGQPSKEEVSPVPQQTPCAVFWRKTSS